MNLLEKPRQISSYWHFVHARDLLEYDNGRMLDNILVYCAIDLRLGIERFAFELLVIAYDLKLDALKEKRINSASRDIFKFIKDDFPDLEISLKFQNIVSDILRQGTRTALIDLKWLERKRADLSNICHLQLRPDPRTGFIDEEFKRKGFVLIQEIIDRLTEWLRYRSAWMPIEKMPQEIQELQSRFMAGNVDEEGVKTSLRLMHPVLQSRFRLTSDS